MNRFTAEPMQIFDGLIDLEDAQFDHPHNPSSCASASLFCILGPEHPRFSELVKLQDDAGSILDLAIQSTTELDISTNIPTSSTDFLNEMEKPATIGSFIVNEAINGIGHKIGTRKLSPELQIHLVADTESTRTMQIMGPNELLDLYLNAKVNNNAPFAGREIFIFTRVDPDAQDIY